MSKANQLPPNLKTVQDLIDHLGGIPPWRVLLSPRPGTAGEDDVIRIERRRDQQRCELIDGVLVRKATTLFESAFNVKVACRLMDHVDQHDLGVTLLGSCAFRLSPGQVRYPDISFLPWDQFPGRELPNDPITPQVPRLVVEVWSQHNTQREMDRKVDDYLRAGVQLVWQIDPDKCTVSVSDAPARTLVLSEDDILTGGIVLPDFELPVKRLRECIPGRKSSATGHKPL
jgi:Uma2 family endonuclease